jgi:putative transcriptional regulator
MKPPKPSEIKRVRDGLGMSQAEFAEAFHLTKDSVQNWEQGRSVPTGTAAVLLWLICNAPQAILKLLKGAK